MVSVFCAVLICLCGIELCGIDLRDFTAACYDVRRDKSTL
jgi:hypothetical protein